MKPKVLLATHSPVVLNAASMDDVLCFAKNDSGSTDIVLGSEHPLLQKWQGEVDLGTRLHGSFGMNRKDLVVLTADKDMEYA